MVLSLSAVLVLGFVIAVLYRYQIITALPMTLCTVFGFLLGGSSLAPAITAFLRWLGTTVGAVHL